MLRARTPPGAYGTWEMFQVCHHHSDQRIISLRGYVDRRRFASAHPRRRGDTALRLTVASPGPWETLEVVSADKAGTFLLWSVADGRYLTIDFPGPQQYAAQLAATTPTEARMAKASSALHPQRRLTVVRWLGAVFVPQYVFLPQYAGRSGAQAAHPNGVICPLPSSRTVLGALLRVSWT